MNYAEMIEQGRENALALINSEQYSLGRELLQQGIKAFPTEHTFYALLGIVESQQGRHVKAKEYFEHALTMHDCPDYHNNLGSACKELGEYEKAKSHFQKAVEDNHLSAVSNLANEYCREGQTGNALELLDQALDYDPTAANLHFNKANILSQEGRHAEALPHYRQALNHDPDNPDYRWNLAYGLLVLGHWQEGWEYFKHRREVFPQHEHKQNALLARRPEWNGEDLDGETIYVYCVQGDGDKIQFARYAKALKDRGATTIMECPDSLLPVLQRVEGIDQLVASQGRFVFKDDQQLPIGYKFDWINAPAFDYHVELMDLPRLLDEPIDGQPYIHYPKAEPFDNSKLNVGIVWAGHAIHCNDHARSCPLKHFEPLAQPDIQLISLQKDKRDRHWPGIGRVDLMEGAEFTKRIIDVGEKLETYDDTARVISALDLLVTVDTSVAHLAGAMGKPVYLLLPYCPDWRWLLNRQDTPWYGSMTLFRQETPGDWATVLKTVANSIDKGKLFAQREEP